MLQDCIRAQPVEGHSLFVITTTSRFAELSGKYDQETSGASKINFKRVSYHNAVNHFSGYNSVVEVPLLETDEEIASILEKVNPTWNADSYKKIAENIKNVVEQIPIKLLLDASRFAERTSKGEVSSNSFMECLDTLLNVY
jgi:hypothetical protein